MITDAEMLSKATAFDILPYDRNRRGLRRLWVEMRPRPDEPATWAIMEEGRFCLNHNGDWEYEPLASNRSDEFLERCRWPTAREAIEFAMDFVRKYPNGQKPDEPPLP